MKPCFYNLICLLLLALLFFNFQTAPNGNPYDYDCTNDPGITHETAGPLVATAYYDDPDGDCLSDNWIIYYYDLSGNIIYTRTDEMWREHTPSANGVWDFSSSAGWDCCVLFLGGGGGGWDSPIFSCPCNWEYDPATFTITISRCD